MSVHTETRPNGLAILFQIMGALALIVVGLIAFMLLFKVTLALVGKLLPLLAIGAVLYVLVRLVVDARR
jgi:hypothetical protein